MSTRAAAVIAMFMCTPLLGQRHLFSFTGQERGDRLGRSVTIPGDIDKDGHDDVLVGADQFNNSARLARGFARLYSGRDGSVLFSYELEGLRKDFAAFGRSVSGAGDVDGDTFLDVVIGAWSFVEDPAKGRRRGAAIVFSGKTGKPIHTWTGNAYEDSFGENVRGAGDVNRDGFADVFVGALSRRRNEPGYAVLFSGKDGSVLKQLRGQGKAGDADLFGFALGAGDVNGDTWIDLMVGAPGEDVGPTPNAGAVYVFSGRDFSLIKRIPGAAQDDAFGWAVDAGRLSGQRSNDLVASGFNEGANNRGTIQVYATRTLNLLATWKGIQGDGIGRSLTVASDLNQDGRADLLIGSLPDAPKEGFAGAISGKAFTDGKSTIEVICGGLYVGQQNSDFYGLAVGAGGDVNADGSPDVVIGAIGTNGRTGSVHVMSCKELALSTDEHVVSLSANGRQRIDMRGPAGASYLVLGTLSGIRPGTMVGSVRVPLNFDAYTDFSIAFPTLLIRNAMGQFDSTGRATATFVATSVLPSTLAGSLFDHAYVVLGSPLISSASNSAPLRLVR